VSSCHGEDSRAAAIPAHSITTSARASRIAGTATPNPYLHLSRLGTIGNFAYAASPDLQLGPHETMRYAASASAFWAGFLNEPARSKAGCASRASRTIGPWRVARIQLKMLLRPEGAHPYGSTRGGRMGSKLTRPLPAPTTRFRTTPTRPGASARRRRTRSPVGPQGPGLRFSRGHRYDCCRAPQVEPEPA
jgi:hypothetical protein